MTTIQDIFKDKATMLEAARNHSGRRQPKCRLFPPGARLIQL